MTGDNTALQGFDAIVKVARDAKLPLIINDPEFVQRGALVAVGIGWYETGKAASKAQSSAMADAEAEYEQALALNPNNSVAHLEYAEWLASHGRVDEALGWSRRARELDPLGKASESIGWIFFQSRRYDDSIRELQSFLAVHPDDAMAHLTLAFPMIAKGQAEEAMPDLEKTALLMHRGPGALEMLATANARAGHRAEALRLIAELNQRRKIGYVQATSFINPNLALGNYDEAFVWFERAYQQQEGILQWLRVHPFFDPVRDDPRFRDLLRRVGPN